MSILITADLHFSDNPRDQYRHDFQEQFRSLVHKYDVNHVFILGDICEAKDHHSAELVNAVINHIALLTDICHIIILKGNHDQVGSSTPFFQFVENIPQVSWIGQPQLTNFDEIGSALFLPHANNYKKDWDFKLHPSWIFAHQTFSGAQVGENRFLDGIPLDVIPKGSKVISGDIHMPQQLGPVTYVGSPYHVDFGDNFNPRVLLIDNKGKLKSIPVTGPQKRLVNMGLPVELYRQKGAPITCNPGDIVKVRVELTAKEYEDWSAIKRQIYEWGEENGFVIYTVQPVISTIKRKAKSQSQLPDDELLKAYAKARAVPEDTLKTGLRLIKET